jgi:hypothetical protein
MTQDFAEIQEGMSYSDLEQKFISSIKRIDELNQAITRRDIQVLERDREIETLKKQHEQRDIEDAKDSENFRLLNDSIREDRDRLQKEVDNAQTFLNTAKNYLNNTLYQSVTVLNAGTHRAKDEAMHKLQQMLVIGIGELAKDLKADEFDFF